MIPSVLQINVSVLLTASAPPPTSSVNAHARLLWSSITVAVSSQTAGKSSKKRKLLVSIRCCRFCCLRNRSY